MVFIVAIEIISTKTLWTDIYMFVNERYIELWLLSSSLSAFNLCLYRYRLIYLSIPDDRNGVIVKICIQNYRLLLIKHSKMLAINQVRCSVCAYVFMFLFVSAFGHSLRAVDDNRFDSMKSISPAQPAAPFKITKTKQNTKILKTRKAKQCHFFAVDSRIVLWCGLCMRRAVR